MMKFLRRFNYILLLCILIAPISLFGCSQNFATQTTNSPSQQVADYSKKISGINTKILNESTDFASATSSSNLDAMKAKRDSLINALGEVEGTEIPDAIKNSGEKYKSACTNLKNIFKEYSDIVIESIEGGSSFAIANNAAKISDLQKQYNDAVSDLKSADTGISDALKTVK